MNEREIFQAAIEIEDFSDRVRYLDQICESQPELRSRLESLLKHHEDAGSFLDRPPAEFDQTRLFDEQATDEELASGIFSEATLLSYLSPCDAPGVMGLLGQYEVLEIIGQGGMGAVLKAKDTKLHRIVAIKLLAPELASNPTARKRFLREAQAAAAVTHDHVVRIYAVGDTLKSPMLVMECIDGQSLQQKIDRTGALETKEILRIGLQTALGLAAAHKQGLVHRDIKPANILLENGIERVKITDFGLARAVDDIGMTKTGQITGTPQYMSPEQAQGDPVDHRSDLFSLGSVLYAMCTGRAAFRAESTMAVLRRVCDDDPRPIREINPEIPSAIVDIVEQLMEKNPDDRIQSAEEVAELLSDLLAQLQQPGHVSLAAVARPLPKSAPRAENPAPSHLAWRNALLILGLVTVTMLGVSEATGVTQFAATMIRVVTGQGTLVVEVDDPNVAVTIEGEDIIITGAGPKEVRLKPGQYRLTATKAGRPIRQELVTVSRNGKKVVRISLEGGQESVGKQALKEFQKDYELVVEAGRGRLTEDEKQKLFTKNFPLFSQINDPNTLPVIQLFANLPEPSHDELKKTGYLKWKFADLDPARQKVYQEALQLNIDMATKGGASVPAQLSIENLKKNGEVGFAVIDIPALSAKVVSWYILFPLYRPIWVTVVGTNAAGKPDYFAAHNSQLVELRKRPLSALPESKSAKLEQQLDLAVKAGRGELNEVELKSLKEGGHGLPDLLDLPVGKHILELLANLPEESRRDLIQKGYLKWPYASLSEAHQSSFAEIVELFFNQAKDMGFGGKKTPQENTGDLLQKADVGFAVLHFPRSQQAITFYVLVPQSPLPVAMPIVPSDPRNWDDLELREEQFDQLRELKRKPNSPLPSPTARSLPKSSRFSLLKKARLLVQGGFRPTWTLDGRQLLYSQYGVSPIEIYELKTGNSRRFLSLPDLDPKQSELRSLADTSISPDGKSVALVMRPLGNGNEIYFQEEVWVVPYSGGPARRIAEGGYPNFGKDPHLLYFQDRKRNVLYSIRLDDPEAKPKELMPCPAWYPAVSPDGQWVAYSVGNQLKIASLQTGQLLEDWTYPSSANGMLLSWSPDSKQVGCCPYEGQNRLGFWCYDLDEKQQVQISTEPIGEVAWSPDGQQLAFTLHSGPPAIYLIDADQLPKLNSNAAATSKRNGLTEIQRFEDTRVR